MSQNSDLLSAINDVNNRWSPRGQVRVHGGVQKRIVPRSIKRHSSSNEINFDEKVASKQLSASTRW